MSPMKIRRERADTGSDGYCKPEGGLYRTGDMSELHWMGDKYETLCVWSHGFCANDFGASSGKICSR